MPPILSLRSDKRISPGQAKNACRLIFLSAIELQKSAAAKQVAIRTIQDMIDDELTVDEFLLRVSFHLSEVVCGTPNFIPAFLKASLNLFRAALIKKEISLEGIKAPEALKEHFRFKSEMKSQGKISPVGQGSEEGQDGDGSGVILEKFPEALKEHSRIKSEMKSQLEKDAIIRIRGR